MAQTYELIVAAVKDDDSAVGSDSLRPPLQKMDTSALFQWSEYVHHLLHQIFGGEIISTRAAFVFVLIILFAFSTVHGLNLLIVYLSRSCGY